MSKEVQDAINKQRDLAYENVTLLNKLETANAICDLFPESFAGDQPVTITYKWADNWWNRGSRAAPVWPAGYILCLENKKGGRMEVDLVDYVGEPWINGLPKPVQKKYKQNDLV